MDEKYIYDPEQPLWSIVTKSRDGTVSVVRDLTLEQVRRTYERLDPWYGMHSTQFTVHKDFQQEGRFAFSSGGCGRTSQSGDIEVREVFGPPGWGGFTQGDIDSWPKITHVFTDDKGNILSDEYQNDVEAARSEQFFREMMKSRS
jgi:hypothetical protein